MRYKASQKQIKAARKYLRLTLGDESAFVCVDRSVLVFKDMDFKKKIFSLISIAFQQKCSQNYSNKNSNWLEHCKKSCNT